MKILVCGGRDYSDFQRVYEELDMIHHTTRIHTLIHGAARGADSLAAEWAHVRNVRTQAFPADWNKYGRSAGPIRNNLMLAEKPDLVVAFPGGRGTTHMVQIAKKAGIAVIEVKP